MGAGLAGGYLGAPWGSPEPLLTAPAPADSESAPQLGLRPWAAVVFPAAERGGQLFIFLAVTGGGGWGWGLRKLTLLVLTLVRASREPLKARGGLGDRPLVGGAWGLPATLLGRLAKANSTGQFLERDVGVSEVEKELAKPNS